MIKILAFGDLHLHHWQEGERSNRLQQCIVCAHRILVAAVQSHVDAVVFLGDLFEAKRLIRAEAVVAAGNVFQFAKKTLPDTPLYMIAGNHDYLGPSSSSVLSAFSAYGIVVDHVVHETFIGDADILMVPHGCSDPRLSDPTLSYDVAFSHGAEILGPTVSVYTRQALKGIRVPEYIRRISSTVHRGAVVCGHYHIPQSVQWTCTPPVVCVGAPMSHDWSDIEQVDDAGEVINKYVRGAVILSIENHKIHMERIVRGNGFPRFFDRRPNCFRDGVDFVREIVTEENDADTRVHENVEEIAGNDVLTAVRTFAQDRAPKDSVAEYTTVGEQLVGAESNALTEEDDEEEL